jgi:hypothetical protein
MFGIKINKIFLSIQFKYSWYNSTRRTLCPSSNNSSINDNRIVVDVTTSSTFDVNFSIAVTIEKDYSVE